MEEDNNPIGHSRHRLVKYFIFLVLMLMMLLPAMQQRFHLFSEKPLRGAFVALERPSFSNWNWNDWLSGSFQDVFNTRLEHNIGFRNSLIRLNNQLHYSFFRQANAEGVIVGKHAELFEEDYIRAYLGEFFIGTDIWDRKAQQLKSVQDTLQKLGKTFVVVFEPGKGSFHSDRFPAKYDHFEKKVSNYDYLLQCLTQNKVNVLDLNAYFVQIKPKSDFPLFPRIGTHWSYYGAAIAADTTLRFLQTKHGDQIPDLYTKSLITDSIRHPDDDIWLAMNLLSDPPEQGLAYPRLGFNKAHVDGLYNLLTIGDSFFFNWLSDSVIYHAFNRAEFWYYNKHRWNKSGAQLGQVSESDFESKLNESDIIMIMITERFHQNFAWNFDEQLYDHFFPGPRDPFERFANRLRINNDDFHRLLADANQKGISVEQRITLEAEYLMYLDYQKNPDQYTGREDRIRLIMMSIRSTPDWYAKVVEKAEINNIPVEEMLRRDAEWMVDHE